jgi:pyruvate formate lyase activating enzyme
LALRRGCAYVYAGNIPGKVGNLEDTRCPHCSERVVERYGYLVRAYNLTPDCACRAVRHTNPRTLE